MLSVSYQMYPKRPVHIIKGQISYSILNRTPHLGLGYGVKGAYGSEHAKAALKMVWRMYKFKSVDEGAHTVKWIYLQNYKFKCIDAQCIF